MKRIWPVVLIVLLLVAAALFALRPRTPAEETAPQAEFPQEESSTQLLEEPDTQPTDPEPADEGTEEDELPVDEEYVIDLQEGEVIEIG